MKCHLNLAFPPVQVAAPNHDSSVIAHYYLGYVEQVQGCLSAILAFVIFCASEFFLSMNSLNVSSSLLLSLNIFVKSTLDGGHFSPPTNSTKTLAYINNLVSTNSANMI